MCELGNIMFCLVTTKVRPTVRVRRMFQILKNPRRHFLNRPNRCSFSYQTLRLSSFVFIYLLMTGIESSILMNIFQEIICHSFWFLTKNSGIAACGHGILLVHDRKGTGSLAASYHLDFSVFPNNS